MSSDVSTVDLLTLLRLPGVGPRGAVRLAEGDLSELRASDEWRDARPKAESVIDECEQLGIGVVGWFDADFPRRLREIPQPAAVLFYRGALGVLAAEESVAIVGTREPTEWGERSTRTIGDAFARAGWVIVSGLALGVDTVAHRSALAAGTPTAAILGNGLASVYPAANRELATQIVETGGVLVSEVPPRAEVEPRALVKRDRLQSGLAALTIVSQGGVGSGAMHTARYAFEQGRPLFCAALDRAGVQPGEQDVGTRALLERPGRELPKVLPGWRRAPVTRLTDAPVATRLDERALNDIGRLVTPEPTSATLF